MGLDLNNKYILVFTVFFSLMPETHRTSQSENVPLYIDPASVSPHSYIYLFLNSHRLKSKFVMPIILTS